MGILRDDPRLKPLIEDLKNIQKKNPGKIYSINNIKLDFNEFSKWVFCFPYLSHRILYDKCWHILFPQGREKVHDLDFKCFERKCCHTWIQGILWWHWRTIRKVRYIIRQLTLEYYKLFSGAWVKLQGFLHSTYPNWLEGIQPNGGSVCAQLMAKGFQLEIQRKTSLCNQQGKNYKNLFY